MSEGPVEYATAGGHGEAVRSLAKAWGVTEPRAADLLADPDEYRAECRSRQVVTVREARRILERRYPCP